MVDGRANFFAHLIAVGHLRGGRCRSRGEGKARGMSPLEQRGMVNSDVSEVASRPLSLYPIAPGMNGCETCWKIILVIPVFNHWTDFFSLKH